jgi:WD40 repeat protein
MADVVCFVQWQPEKVSFTWSEGPDAFPTYHLTGQHVDLFREDVELARKRLAELVDAYLDYLHSPSAEGAEQAVRQACLQLAEAGYQLRQRVFKPNEDPGKTAKDVSTWLRKLHSRGQLASLEIVTEGGQFVPWNLLYEERPDPKTFLAGGSSLDHWQPFWGIRHNLAGGQRVDPRRRMPFWEKPRVLLVVDPSIRKGLPAPQRERLEGFARARGLPLIGSPRELKEALRAGRPDLMYWLSHATPAALVLGDEDDSEISPTDLLRLLEEDGEEEELGGLVFLNACRTAETTPTAGSFFKAVFGLKMSGLIATEQQTVDTFACPFGLDFLEAFLDRGEPAGKVLQSLRARVPADLQALPTPVLLGLLYGAYCPPQIQVITAGAAPAPTGPAPAPAAPAAPVAGGRNLGPQAAPREVPLPEKPYRSLRYYTRAERALFAGRDGDVARFGRILDDAGTRLLVLHGESGCGKSSFLHAGVIPFLEEECHGFRFLRDRKASEVEPVLLVRATGDLPAQLAQALCGFCARPFVGRTPTGKALKVDLAGILARLLGAPVEPGRLRERLAAEPAFLGRALAALDVDLPFTVVLVIDQCEEVFTLNWRAEDRPRRDLSLELLRQTLAVSGAFKLIVALRTEYYGRLVDRLRRGVHEAVGVREYLLTDFDEERLTEAIRRPTSTTKVLYSSEVPFEKYGFRYAEGVAEQIARQVVGYTRNRQDSVLPLAQVICSQLYELVRERPEKVIQSEDVRRIGGVQGGMRKHVEALLPRLFPAVADRRAFQRLLAGLYRRQPDGTLTTDLLPSEDAARRWAGSRWARRMPFEAMVNVASEGDWRLLRVSMVRGEGGERQYLSLGHDALAKVADEWAKEQERWRWLLKWFSAAAVMTVVAAVLLFLAYGMQRAARQAAAVAKESEERAKQLTEQRQLMEQVETKNRRRSYVWNMDLAVRSWQASEVGRALELLDAQRPLPGQDDLRGFEWYHLWRESHRDVMTFRGHEGTVYAVDLSPDGKLLASASKDGTVRLWDVAARKPRAVLGGHQGAVYCVALSPDGTLLASGGEDRTVRLWDVATGQLRSILRGHDNEVNCLAFSPDRQLLASAGKDKTIRLWELRNAQVVATLPGHDDQVFSLAFAPPDGQALASASLDRTVKLWDTTRRQCVQTLKKHTDKVYALAFAPDGKWLATAGADQRIWLWDLTQTAAKPSGPLLAKTELYALAISPKGQALAAGGWNGIVTLWDIKSRQVRASLKGHTDEILALAFARDGQSLVSGSSDKTIRLWDADVAGQKDMPRPDRIEITSLALTPDERTVVSSTGNGIVQLWDLTKQQLMDVLPPAAPGSQRAPDSAAHLAIADGRQERGVATYSAEIKRATSPSCSVAVSSDGTALAESSPGNAIRVWDRAQRRVRHTLNGHTKPVSSLAAAPGGPVLASAGKDGAVKLWDLNTGRELRTLQGPNADEVYAVAFSPPNAGLVAAGGSDRVIRLWDVAGGGKRQELRGHTDNVLAVTFAPDGRTLASGGSDRTVRIWDVASGREIRAFRGPVEKDVAFSPDGKVLAVGGGDGNVRLWDVESGQERAVFREEGWVSHAVFAADGRMLVTGNNQGQITLRLAATEQDVFDYTKRVAEADAQNSATQKDLVLAAYALSLHLRPEQARQVLQEGREVLLRLKANDALTKAEEGWLQVFDEALTRRGTP